MFTPTHANIPHIIFLFVVRTFDKRKKKNGKNWLGDLDARIERWLYRIASHQQRTTFCCGLAQVTL